MLKKIIFSWIFSQVIFSLFFSQLVFSQNVHLKFEKIIGDMRGKAISPLSVSVSENGDVYLLMLDGRVSIFDKEGKYLKSTKVKLPWPPYTSYLAVIGKRAMLGDYKKDYPWIYDEQREGKEAGKFNRPSAVVVDGKGNVYVSDTGNKRIQIFSPDNTEKPENILNLKTQPVAISVKGNFLAIADRARDLLLYEKRGSQFSLISSLKVNPGAVSVGIGNDNSIYVAYRYGRGDSLTQYVLKDGKLKEEKTIAPSYYGLWPNFYPARVSMVKGPDNNIWFASGIFGSILSLDPKTDKVKVRIKGIHRPLAIGFDKKGKIYVAGFPEPNKKGPSLTVYSPDGEKIGTFGPKILYEQKIVPVWGLLPAEDGGIYLRIVEKGYRKGWPAFTIKKVYSDGKMKNFIDFGNLFAVRRRFNPTYTPYSLTFDKERNIILAAMPLVSIVKISPDGKIIWEAGIEPQNGGDKIDFSAPADVAIDPKGNIWVVDAEKDKIFCISKEGKLLFQYGKFANIDDTEGKGFDAPTGIAVVSVKGKEFLYVGDTGNQRIVKYQILYGNNIGK